ncbi:hypothetical protein Ancab_001321 [Ancistrocladus abbreviatus]
MDGVWIVDLKEMGIASVMQLRIFTTGVNSNSAPLTSIPSSLVTSNHVQLLPPFSRVITTSILSNFKFKNQKQVSRVSSQGGQELPPELTDDSKFVPLNADDPRYGPPALLLLGFEVEEEARVQQLLKDLDGEFLLIIYCTEDMITRSLWEAMNTRQISLENVKIAKSLPRICFLSGLSGEEMIMFIDAFQETELEPAVFAALVPNSADKPLQELIEEIMGDHEMLSARQSASSSV